ncbi:MAG TPA: hypothetical protein VG520_00235 [Candidatus Dormibacteraeota bacterium]|jgi:hypothetical protein|nr:hypothetical protein [Candidatus Dormibacteraeota bacterium]
MQLTAPVALAGAADTAIFLAQRPQLFSEARGRALGSAAFAGLWLALATSSAAQRSKPGAATVALAGTVAAGNAAMLAIHLRHRVAGPRVLAGAALSAVALADVLRRR